MSVPAFPDGRCIRVIFSRYNGSVVEKKGVRNKTVDIREIQGTGAAAQSLVIATEKTPAETPEFTAKPHFLKSAPLR